MRKEPALFTIQYTQVAISLDHNQTDCYSFRVMAQDGGAKIFSALTVLQLDSFHSLSRVEPWNLTADFRSNIR